AHHMETAFGLGRAGPAALAARARERAMRAPDGGVAAVVELVVGQVMLVDVVPAALVVPVGERRRLPELVRLVPADLRRVRARRRLVAADARDPRVEPAEGAVERLHLPDRAAEVGLALPEPVAV